MWYIYVCIAHTYICMYIRKYVSTQNCIFVLNIRTYVHTYVAHMYMNMFITIHIRTSHVHVHICTYTRYVCLQVVLHVPPSRHECQQTSPWQRCRRHPWISRTGCHPKPKCRRRRTACRGRGGGRLARQSGPREGWTWGAESPSGNTRCWPYWSPPAKRRSPEDDERTGYLLYVQCVCMYEIM